MFNKLVLFTATVCAAATWTPASMMKVKPVAAVTPSPDGKLVVWTESRALMEGEKSEMLVQLWLGKTDGSSRFQLTSGDKSATAPAWSPDSKTIYFLRGGQVEKIPVDGGEAEAATKFAGSVQSFDLSPNGKWIAFTGRETDKDDEAARREKRDFKVIDENPKNAALFVQLLSSGKPRKVASGPWHVANLDWSPDSARIAFETHPTPGADDGPIADVMEVEVETGNVRAIATTKGTESSPRYSPDGKYIAFVHIAGEAARVLRGSRVALYTRANGNVRDLPASHDESPQIVGWAKDSTRIYFAESRGTRSELYVAPVDGPITTLYAPTSGTNTGVTLNATATHFGMVSQTPNEPAEAYVLDLASNKPVRVSEANTGIPRTGIAETRLIKWKSSKDGKEIEGLLTLPLGYQAGRKYPLILNIHGGPAGAFNEQFIGNAAIYPIAAFAEKGFAVLRPNPRGSSAYGRGFRNANVNDWGGGDYLDLMSGVDEVIKQGIADADKLAVMGWSYGGYMTNWVITQTSRFKCAASGAGLSNMASMWGTNDIPGLIDEYFTGPWYDQPQRYENLSPLFHAKKVTTPTLFLHGEQDFRVPITQAYEMHNALERRGVATQMVAYPRTPHGPQEPKFLQDVMQRHLDWVDRYIQ
ncbi:prolyl oligopeptidase [Bryobacterales bacterium F-183]|nr:prolyl oligopeptidase [Bryobacterales bacterium F-183]